MSQTTPYETIIRQRGGVTAAPPEMRGINAEGIYTPFESEPMSYGFLLIQASRRVDRFAYASLGDVSHETTEQGEYLIFSHRTKAVTLRGQNLFPLVELINENTLSKLYQHDGQASYHREKPLITDVKIDSVQGSYP